MCCTPSRLRIVLIRLPRYAEIMEEGYDGVIRTIPELIDELRYHKGITFQYFFGSQRALDKLTRL